MSEFQDAKGRTWVVVLDFDVLRAIRSAANVDLGAVEKLAETWAKLLSDDETALATLWAVVKPAAGDVTHADWLKAMNGNTLEAGVSALGEAVINFTRPLRREIATTAIQGIQAGYAEAVAKAQSDLATQLADVTNRALGPPLPKSPVSSDISTRNGRYAKPRRR